MNAKNMIPMLAALALLAGSPAAMAENVTCTLAYPVERPFPANAIAEAEILDEFAADAPVVVAHTVVPVSPTMKSIEVSYDPAHVQGNHPYSLAVVVKSGDSFVFYAPKKYEVLTMGHPSRATIQLASVTAPPQLKAYGPALEETYWKLMSIRGATLPAKPAREAYLLLRAFQRQVSGTGGCNRLSGSYESTAQTVTFSQVAATRMACRAGTHSDDALLKVLQGAKKWQITDDRMELQDASGAPLASFLGIPPLPDLNRSN